MSRWSLLLRHFQSRLHVRRKGHEPVWFEMGAGERDCLECVMKRSGGPRGGRQRLVIAPALRPL